MKRAWAFIGPVAALPLALSPGFSLAQVPGDQPPVPANPPAQGAIVPDALFDEWAFGRRADAQQFGAMLERMLQKKVNEVDRMFVLTAGQREKLKLAGRGDIKRLREMVEDARREFDLAKSDFDRLKQLRSNLKNLDVMVTYGPFEFGSLFEKTMRKMFNENQLKRRPMGQRQTSERA